MDMSKVISEDQGDGCLNRIHSPPPFDAGEDHT